MVFLNYVIGCWTRPMTTSIYIKEENGRVTMKLEVPQEAYFTLSSVMIQRVLLWEAQKKGGSSH